MQRILIDMIYYCPDVGIYTDLVKEQSFKAQYFSFSNNSRYLKGGRSYSSSEKYRPKW